MSTCTTDFHENAASTGGSGLKHHVNIMSQQLPLAPVEVSKEQRKAIDLAKAGKSIFVTGAAGSGKSYVLKAIAAHCLRHHGDKLVAITALSGVASRNIGGQTLARFGGLGVFRNVADMGIEAVSKRILSNQKCQSMVSHQNTHC